MFPDGSVQRSAATNSTVITGSTPTGTLQVTQTGAGLSVTPTQQDPPAAVRGAATATLGSVAGIGGESISPAGYGVLGLNSASSGDATGVAGYSTQSPYGIGVYGEASSTDASAAPTGVLGVVNGTGVGASGVWGDASGTSGLTTGVYGDAFSPDGYGVEGDAFAQTGVAIGVAGFSDSDQGRGVMGNATSPTGQTYVLINEVPRDHWGNAGTIYSPT